MADKAAEGAAEGSWETRDNVGVKAQGRRHRESGGRMTCRRKIRFTEQSGNWKRFLLAVLGLANLLSIQTFHTIPYSGKQIKTECMNGACHN